MSSCRSWAASACATLVAAASGIRSRSHAADASVADARSPAARSSTRAPAPKEATRKSPGENRP
eukprot:8761260-Lingulodinium_polyedra.AAC.1